MNTFKQGQILTRQRFLLASITSKPIKAMIETQLSTTSVVLVEDLNQMNIIAHLITLEII
jgi:hypothetical protein